jgi:hypothetical protein
MPRVAVSAFLLRQSLPGASALRRCSMPLRFALVLSLASGAAAEVRVRDVSVGVSTADGNTVDDLSAAEFRIEEDGKERAVLGLARDQRPVDVALILDSSESMREDYRTTLVPAAMDFWRALPEWARLTIWTTGGRTFHAVDFDVELATGESRLQKVATGGVRFTLDAIVKAASDLQEEPLARRVVVVVTGESIPYDKPLIEETVRVIPEARVMPVVILIKSGASTRIGGTGISWEVEPFFGKMAEEYGGGADVVTSALSVGGLLRRTAAELTSQYLVRFESESEHPVRPDVAIDREGVRARPGLAMLVAPDP